MYTKLTHFFGANNCKLMNILIEYIGIGTAPPNVAIWDKFSEQHQHQSNKKHHIQCPMGQFALFWVKIRYKFNAYFGWVLTLSSGIKIR